MVKLIKTTSELFLKILNNGLQFTQKNIDGVGEVIVMNPREALSYAIITSHGYLDEAEPASMYNLTRDLFRVFNHALKFDLQEGVFSTEGFGPANTINSVIEKKPYLSKGDKYILPISYVEYEGLSKKINELIKNLKNSDHTLNNFIIAPIPEKQSQLESFYEYVVSIYFNRQMFLTDTQIPFFYASGTPDVAAYKITDTIETLQEYGFLEKGGSIVDLMSISSFGFYEKKNESKIINESIVFDVKTLQASAPQISKYIKTGIFERAYEIIPVEKEPGKFGLFTINQNGEIIISESSQPIKFEHEKQTEYFNWLDVYLKMYVLANLSAAEIKILTQQNNLTNSELLEYTKKVSLEELLISTKKLILDRDK